jgi:hypothetical protein
MNFLHNITSVFAITTVALSSFFGLQQHTPTSNHLSSISIIHQMPKSFYSASTSISSQGYTLTINMKIPKDGGKVYGNISGNCTGAMHGQYDGKDNGKILGQTNVLCNAFFIQIPATATFTGTVNKEQLTMDLKIQAKAESFEKSETVSLPLKP